MSLERAFENNDILTLVYCLIFLSTTFVKSIYPTRFFALLSCLFSNKLFLDFAKQLQDVFTAFKVLLFVIQNLIFSAFFYLLIDFNKIAFDGTPAVLFIKIFTVLTLYLSAQYLLSMSIAKIFSFTEIYRIIHILKFSYLKLVAFALWPILILYTYSDVQNTSLASTFLICYFVILMALRSILVLVNNNKIIIQSLFYFIVYLCTLEIAPVLLMYKVMVNK